MEFVTAKPEFTSLSDASVLEALNDTDPDNPVVMEVARLIDGYTRNFAATVERLGYLPASILHVRPGSQIEAIAMRITTDAIRDELRAAGEQPTSPTRSDPSSAGGG